MLVREAMTAPVVTIPRNATVKQAIRLLYERNITAAPVVDPDTGRLVGIVSEMDLLRREYESDPRAFLRPAPRARDPLPADVGELMSPHVLTARETSDVAEVAELMMSIGVKSVPVLRGHEVVGILSRRDLLRLLARADDRIREDVVAALQQSYPDGARWLVTVHEGVVELRGRADERSERVAEVLARTVPGVVRVTLLPG